MRNGDESSADGGTLGREVAITGNGFGGPPYFTREDIVLVGNGLTLVQTTSVVIPSTQSVEGVRFEIALTEGG